ncbi:MAG: pknB 19 [Verrucomicrobiales bacterium]|nr:pknB 19 [Verrucomicrobiales bacterium]
MDRKLRQRVERMLAMADRAEAFITDAPDDADDIDDRHKIFNRLKSDLEDRSEELIGQKIGRYKILERLGEGGCGVVYVAEQTEPVRRHVALKVIKLGMDTRQVIARFEAERQVLAVMDHPNIAKVFDAGSTESGRPFFVMELVHGVRITDFCDRNNLSTQKRLNLFIEVCQAIQHAHQKGIIHRDIKPSNILITLLDGTPRPKVIDFGIAKATERRLTDATTYTPSHLFVGTPAYMSPEQAGMSGVDIDTRSDIYSLGVLLYELLAGKTPFDVSELMSQGIDVMRRTIREKEPTRPSTKLARLDKTELTTAAKRRNTEAPRLLHELRGDLDWIVMKCLEKERTRRYDTASSLANDLKRHLTNEPVLACPPTPLYRFRKAFRRNRIAFLSFLAIAVALLLGIVGSTWQAFRAGTEATRAAKAEKSATAEAARATKAELRETALRKQAQVGELAARLTAYASDMNTARQAISESNYGRAAERLNRHRPEPGQEDLRGWEWRYLWQQARSDALFTLPREAYRQIVSLAVSHDGRWLAAGVGRQAGLAVWDLQKKQVSARLAKDEKLAYAAFSPTQPLLAFSSLRTTPSGQEQSRLHFWNTDRQRMVAELPLDDTCFGLAFSKDGSALATCTGKEITLWQMPSGIKISSYRRQGRYDTSEATTQFAITSDLSIAAYGSGYDLWVVDLRQGKETWTARPWDMNIAALAFSPDGKTLAGAAGYALSEIRLWNVATGEETGHLEGHTAWTTSLMFWPDGKKLASSSADQTIRIWDLASQKCADVLRGRWSEVWRVVLLPDAKTLVSSTKDGSICFWDTSVTHPRTAFVTLPIPVVEWRFAPDSQSVLALDHRGEVSRWSGADFQQKEFLLNAGVDFDSHILSDDARWLAIHRPNGVVRVWDVSNLKQLHEWTNFTKGEQLLRIEPGGDKLITWSRSENLLRERERTTGLETQSWRGPEGILMGFDLSPDRQSCLSFGEGNELVARNLADKSGAQLDLKMEPVLGALGTAFSPDGRLLAIANSSLARAWDTATWRNVGTMRHFLKGVVALSFSPDSRRLVTASSDHDAIRLWATENWQDVLTLDATGFFYQPAFSPDGNTLGAVANGSGDILYLWRAPSWKQIAAAEAMESKEGIRPQ